MFEWLSRLLESDPTAAAHALREAELSHNQVHTALRDALKASLAPGASTYIWPKDVYDDRVVYEVESPTGTHLFQRTYAINEAGQVTLGADVAEVKAETVYTPVQSTPPPAQPAAPATEAARREEPGIHLPIRETGEQDGWVTREPISEAAPILVGDVIPLVEKSMRRDGTVPLKIIQPGWGTSGYYDAKVLERDGAAAFPKGTKMYWDHPTVTEESERPERSLRDLAATLIGDARFTKDGPAGPGLYADAKVIGTYKESVEELAPHIGTSIRTHGTAKPGTVEGKSGPIVEALLPASPATSIDFVTTPGAGGQVLQLFEAARGGRANPAPQPIQEDTPVGDELSESVRQRLEAQDTEIARLREATLFREARDVATVAIGRYDLPDITRARLVESLAKNPPLTEAKALDVAALTTRVEEAVKAEVEYLARATGIGDGQVRNLGEAASASTVTPEEAEKQLTSAFQRMGLSESAAKQAAAGREH